MKNLYIIFIVYFLFIGYYINSFNKNYKEFYIIKKEIDNKYILQNEKINIKANSQTTPNLFDRLVEVIVPSANAGVLDSLALNDCRITQGQDSHMKKGNGSMYAIDIACVRGESFKVFTPDYFDTYVIEYISKDKRLGNFLIIKHGEYRFVYGHTQTDKNVGDRLGKHEVLGITDTSGISTSEHLHIELWRNNNNINWHKLTGGELEVNPKSFDLRMQRGLVTDSEINQLILNHIAQYEGKHLESYWDINHWSIGYGTISYQGETITDEEADKRARQVINNIRIKYNLYDQNLAQLKAIVSYVYNIGSLTNKQQRLLNNGMYCALGNDFAKYVYITVNGEKQIAGGLVKRRQSEQNLLCY